ncbi:15-hydroxyprostaglandin dehydrogenase [NAD(+)]-like [Pogonomyrmex barbatus]|uniref:15-hydroxyprostaglandin dehydrogenase [NAD(+)] n=1 Tax=Pogonomyrmex barbatus TaxID=144034 RepID=A0A6I9XNQ6_9HYME|nr:15-hydroxyprostaglandin dehydrogenase [NAD(+)]-like [Pogonomyrmex barbatus]
MDNVQNKTALVTGAGSGIGYCIAEELLRKGAKKVAIDDLPITHSYNGVVSLQEQFGKERVIFFPVDITNIELYNETFKQVVNILNGLDILVNNAGIMKDVCIEQTFAVNVVALIRGSLLALDHMGKHKGGKGGTIVNIASRAGLEAFPTAPVYSTSKYAVIGFSLNLEKFYDKTKVRVLTMCPSFTTTEMFNLYVTTNKFLDFVDMEVIEQYSHEPQKVTHVGQSVVELIQKGENGSIWVVQHDMPPFAITVKSHDLTKPIEQTDIHV